MIGRRVVKVYGALDEPEAEDAGVEIEIPLRIARDTGDVVNTGGAEAHRTDSCLASFRDFVLIGPCARIAIALCCRGSGTLFLLSPGWHNTSSSYPSIKATDMPFAEASM